jgi:hypothetical protein
MNRLDKELKKSLRFYAKCTSKKIHRMANEDPIKYRQQVPIFVENYLVKGKYVLAEEFRNDPKETFPITPEGLNLLMSLEQAEIDKKSFWISILAVVVSFFTLILFLIQVSGGAN